MGSTIAYLLVVSPPQAGHAMGYCRASTYERTLRACGPAETPPAGFGVTVPTKLRPGRVAGGALPGSERRGEVLSYLQASPEPADDVVLMRRAGQHRNGARSDGENRMPGPMGGVPTPRTANAAGRPMF